MFVAFLLKTRTKHKKFYFFKAFDNVKKADLGSVYHMNISKVYIINFIHLI